MKKIFSAVLSLLCILSFAACDEDNSTSDPNMVRAPESASYFENKDYKTVESRFQNAGFTHVKTEKIEDLITGWVRKDGSVKSVAIGGNDEFSEGDEFKKDIDVVIRYHTFASGDDSKNKESESKPSSSSNNDSSESAVPKTDENTKNSGGSEEVLTSGNNPDLAAALNETNPESPVIKAFAEKYEGKVVEFDGAVGASMPHGNYKTRVDMLINAGDYSPDYSQGPDFRIISIGPEGIKDKNGDSHLPGLFPVGSNVHVKGTVGDYDPDPASIFLTDVTLSERG